MEEHAIALGGHVVTLDDHIKSYKSGKITHEELLSFAPDDVVKRFNLITRNLQEKLEGSEHLLVQLLKNKNPVIYWGTAPTGRIHAGYFCPMLKLADYLEANCNVIVLLADLHAFLDSMKSPLEKVKMRSIYYQTMITQMLIRLGVDISKLQFVLGSSYQQSKEFTIDLFKMANRTKVSVAKTAGAEIVKQTEDPYLGSLLYPIMQALDEEHLGVDFFFGGIDQRKTAAYARDMVCPELKYKKRGYLFNPMIAGLSAEKNETGEKHKMSSSENVGKLDLLDTSKEINKKVSKAYCLEGDIMDNTPLQLCKNLIFPLLERLNIDFTITRDEKYGGNIVYKTYSELETDFASKALHPMDLKLGLSENINKILDPIREFFKLPEQQKLLVDCGY
jgi:tyrosyl-tRNA synthetase